MKTLARILTGVVALFFLGFGLAFLINPDAVIGQVSISAVGIAGMSTIRANMAGAFATAGIFLAIAAIMARKNALLAPGVFWLSQLSAGSWVWSLMAPTRKRYSHSC